MDTGGYVRLLGRASVQLGDRSIDLLPNKRFQLLAYLAYQGDWVSRDKLAFLFWPDETDHIARHNLRQLLKHIRKMAWLEGFEADEYRLRWAVDTDVASFKEALQNNKVEQTPSLYQGPLLPNLEGDGEGEFGEWLAMEREGLHGRWRESLLGRVEELTRSGHYDGAALLLQTLLERDPLDEEGLQAYMRSAAKAGYLQQALSAYRAFGKRLQAELGMEPTSVSEQLAKEIEDALLPLPPRPATSVPAQLAPSPDWSWAFATATRVTSSLPKAATSFVGRDLELAEVVHLLSQKDCRLLTLTGAGGVGKTRLALQAAQELGKSYPDGVYFVPLDSVTSATSIPTALANVLGLELRGQEEPLDQVIGFLHGKHAFLVLDNYEHLLEGATITSELLQGCPNLKLLVTSRERLNVEEEWLLPVEGLSYPTDVDSLEKALAHDAVELFTQRAKRVQPSFTLTEEELPHVLEVSHLVQGFPLGIELAAAWVRAMPVEEIAKEIGRDYDFLSSTSRNVTDRHRSIRAAFEYSWRLLSDKEQDVLGKLSVFRGGFRKEAAAYVAGASYAILAALVDKSLVRVSPEGRYDLHPLMYQYLEKKLAGQPPKKLEVEEKRNAYYFRLLYDWELYAIRGGLVAQAPPQPEIENICAAWSWLVTNQNLEEMRLNAFRLVKLLNHCLLLSRAVAILTPALENLDENRPEHRSVLGRINISLEFAYFFLGDRGRAAQSAQRTINLLHPAKDNLDRHSIWSAHLTLGGVHECLGEWVQAQQHYETALIQTGQLRDTLDDAPTERFVLVTTAAMALSAQYKGDYKKAELYYQKIEANRTRDIDIASSYGDFLALTGRWDEAVTAHERAVRRAREDGHTIVIALSLSKLALIYCNMADFNRAKTYLQEAVDIVEVIREGSKKVDVAQALTDIGRAYTALACYDAAQTRLEQAIRLAWNCKEMQLVLHALVALAELGVSQGHYERACTYLAVTQHRSDMRRETADLINTLAVSLGVAPSPAVTVDANREDNTSSALTRIVEEILRLA